MENYDQLLQNIADYALDEHHFSTDAYKTITSCLMDAMGCGLLALNHAEASNLVNQPFVLSHEGVRIPGMDITLTPTQAAFAIGSLNRWLDYNDTWLAKEWGHPSDNFAAILVAAFYVQATMSQVLTAGIIAYEIQGIIALDNAFNEVGLDHVILVKLASTAACGRLLGLNKSRMLAALSQCFVDGQALRTYRHAPNTGSRKSWAAGDACSRALTLLWYTIKGEKGYPSALTAPKWGFQSVLFNQQKLNTSHSFSEYVVNNILFKVSYPAEFHAQTAIEAAQKLKSEISDISLVSKVIVKTQEAGMRIISKQGPLKNPADRDHCLEYMVAVALLDDEVTDASYLDERASDSVLESLRDKIVCMEDPSFTEAYFDPSRRAIPNSVQVEFNDGRKSSIVQVDYPLGHKCRRAEAIQPLLDKFIRNAKTRYNNEQVDKIVSAWKNDDIKNMDIMSFWNLWPNSF
ncbi:MAG: 2-methylcitrate dehydratase [Legionellales bacterium]|nr:2-methylcitrate dehydratase [Legionellales bacterium]